MKNNTTCRPLATILSMIICMSVLLGMLPVNTEFTYAKVKRPGKVTGVKAKRKGRKVILTWKKAGGASRYRIWIKDNGSGWRILKKSTKSRKVSVKCKKGHRYSFRIKGIGKSGRLSRYYSKTVKRNIPKSSNAKDADTKKSKKPKKGDNRKFYLITPSEVTVKWGEEIDIKVRGTETEDPVYWDCDMEGYVFLRHDFGKDCSFQSFYALDATVTATSESGIKLKVLVHVMEPERQYIEVDGIKFYGASIDENFDNTLLVEEINTNKAYDPDKLKLVVDFPNPTYIYGENCKLKGNIADKKEDLVYLPYSIKSVSSPNIGDISVVLYGTYDKYPISDAMKEATSNWIKVSGHSCIPSTGKPVKTLVKLYYKNTLILTTKFCFESMSKEDDISYSEEWGSKCWTKNMTAYEKLEAVSKYIAENYTYKQTDCRAAGIIYKIAREMGLVTWMQYQESDFRTYDPLCIWAYPTIGEHRSAIVVINGEQYAFHVQGGSYHISKIDPVTGKDSAGMRYCTVKYSKNPF